MSDNPRKRPRKCKLEPREDLDDDFMTFCSLVPNETKKYKKKIETVVSTTPKKLLKLKPKLNIKPTARFVNVTKVFEPTTSSPRKFSVEVEVEECDDTGKNDPEFWNDSPDNKRNLEALRDIKPFKFGYDNSETFKIPKTEEDEPQINIKQEPQDEDITEYVNKTDDVDHVVIKEEFNPQDLVEYEDDIIQLNPTQAKEEPPEDNQKELEPKKKADNDTKLFRTCTSCQGMFTSLEQYIMHLSWHGIVRYTCPDCRKRFLLYTDLKDHIKCHLNKDFGTNVTSDNEVYYQCKKCWLPVPLPSFFQHWESHIDWNNREGIVPRVDTKTPQKLDAQLRNDVIALVQNPDKKKFVKDCIVCPRSFDRRNDCKRHLIEHLLCDTKSSDNDELICQICGEATYTSIGFRKHLRMKHACWKEIKCGQCGRCFSDSSNLAKHKKVHLTNAYVCETCGKKFIAKKTLKHHVMIHMKTPPLICHTCDKVFYTPSQYKKHLRGHHDSLLKRYVCNRCNDRFMSLKYLWNHSWEVHGIRKDQTANCPICKEEYRTQHDVKRHMKNVHHMKYNKNNKINYLNIMKIMDGDADDDDTLVIYE